MKIKVEYSGQLRKSVGTAVEEIRLSTPDSVQGLIRRLAEEHGESFRNFVLDDAGRLRSVVLVFVGEDQLDWSTERELRDGDVVMFMSAIAGGC